MRVVLVHGIYAAEGKSNIGKLTRYFTDFGYECTRFEYGFMHFWQARWQNKDIAKRLLAITLPGDIVVGHSNGGAVIWQAARMGARFGGAALINPALDAGRSIDVPWCDIYHNNGDQVVWWSRLLRWHPWGEMGATGYQGMDLSEFGGPMCNIDCADTPGMPQLNGHLDFFQPGHVTQWGRFLADRIHRRLTA